MALLGGRLVVRCTADLMQRPDCHCWVQGRLAQIPGMVQANGVAEDVMGD